MPLKSGKGLTVSFDSALDILTWLTVLIIILLVFSYQAGTMLFFGRESKAKFYTEKTAASIDLASSFPGTVQVSPVASGGNFDMYLVEGLIETTLTKVEKDYLYSTHDEGNVSKRDGGGPVKTTVSAIGEGLTVHCTSRNRCGVGECSPIGENCTSDSKCCVGICNTTKDPSVCEE